MRRSRRRPDRGRRRIASTRSARSRRGRRGGRLGRRRSPAITWTSMSPLPRTISSSSEPRKTIAPARVRRLADDDARDVVLARVVEDRARATRRPDQAHDVAPSDSASRRCASSRSRSLVAERRGAGRLDVRRGPRRAQARRHAPRRAHQPRRRGRRADADEDALAGRPRRRDAVLARGRPSTSASTRSAVRRSASSRSASRLPRWKKCCAARARLLGEVDLALASRSSSSSGGESTSSISSARSSTASGTVSRTAHAGDLRDHVVQALDVLDVERGVDVDAGVEQLAARPASAWRGALPGALVWASSSRISTPGLRASAASRSNSSSVRPAVLDRCAAAGSRARAAAPPVSERPCVSTAADDDVDCPRRASSRASCEHRVGLADAGREAEEDLAARARARALLGL